MHDKALAELEELSGEVSIGAAECETVRLLAQAMVKVRERHPRIRFHMYDANVSDVLERIDAGLDDFGLVLEPADLSRYDFLNLPPLDQWALVMRRDHPLAGCTSIRKEDLAGVPLIVPRNSSKRNDLSGWLEGGVDALNVVGTANILHNSELMVEEGFGCKLALADSLIAGRSDRASGLVSRPLEPPVMARMSLIWRKGQPMSRVCRTYLDAVRRLATA